jgi:hypothetical protein
MMKTPLQEALDAGLSHRTAARWIAYLNVKARRGEKPIELHEAVDQVRAVRPWEVRGAA